MRRPILFAVGALGLVIASSPTTHADYSPIGSAANPSVVTPAGVLPVFDSRERLARAGAYYIFSTGSGGDFTKGGVAVAPGSYLNVRFCNVSTTKTVFVTKRIFDSSSAGQVPYGGVSSPVAMAGAAASAIAITSASNSNITVGSAASPSVQMTYSVGTGHIDNAAGNATPTGTGYIPPNDKYELTELRILPPGTCFGNYLWAPTGLGSATMYLGARVYAYEE